MYRTVKFTQERIEKRIPRFVECIVVKGLCLPNIIIIILYLNHSLTKQQQPEQNTNKKLKSDKLRTTETHGGFKQAKRPPLVLSTGKNRRLRPMQQVNKKVIIMF